MTTTNETVAANAELLVAIGANTSMIITNNSGSDLFYSFTSGTPGHKFAAEDTLTGITTDIYVYNPTQKIVNVGVSKKV